MPQKRKRRLKDHKQLEELARSHPARNSLSSEPDRLADVCLYDFVTRYDWQTKDKNGERKYSLLLKRKTKDRTTFIPLSSSLYPFTSESSLLGDNETAEAAFSRLMTDDSSAYHKKLQKMLEARIQKDHSACIHIGTYACAVD